MEGVVFSFFVGTDLIIRGSDGTELMMSGFVLFFLDSTICGRLLDEL